MGVLEGPWEGVFNMRFCLKGYLKSPSCCGLPNLRSHCNSKHSEKFYSGFYFYLDVVDVVNLVTHMPMRYKPITYHHVILQSAACVFPPHCVVQSQALQ